MKFFSNDMEAVFKRRPNRFLIIAEKDGKEIACHCPNPGRLSELLFPGTELILERREGTRTGWMTAALKREVAPPARGSGIVPLNASRANEAAEELILRRVIPGLREIRREYKTGNSRFDFLCAGSTGEKHLVEVKACSLVEHGLAMFPDAPSARALKHLEELKALGSEGFLCHILFVITHGEPETFMPNIHTDPAFALALCRYGSAGEKAKPGKIAVHAALVRCEENGATTLRAKEIPVDIGPSTEKLAAADSGNYLVLLELPDDSEIETGALGKLHLKKGWYVYTGSAAKNLSARIARHQRKGRKRKHWHIDYLRPAAKTVKTFPIRTFKNLECCLAESLEKIGGKGVPGFGCSDCRCKSHLLYFSTSPEEKKEFQEALFRRRHVDFRH